MAVVIPEGVYTFTRGAPLPPEVAGGRQEGACDYFWAVLPYTSECPDQWAGEVGILVDVIDESGFENCPATFPIDGSSEPGDCPGNINGYDRASTTAFYCKDADGIFQYAGGSLCCEYFPCGTNPGVTGTTLGCNCPEDVQTNCCEEPLPRDITVELSGAACSAVNVTFVASYDDGLARWVGFADICGIEFRADILCSLEGEFSFVMSSGGNPAGNIDFLSSAVAISSCDPFLASASITGISYTGDVATCCGISSDDVTATFTRSV